jgi:hypothetical protein
MLLLYTYSLITILAKLSEVLFGLRGGQKDGKSEQSEPWIEKRKWVMGEAIGNSRS